jgi:hypothetical protein
MERNPLQREKEVLSFLPIQFSFAARMVEWELLFIGCCRDQIRARHSERRPQARGAAVSYY